ncbi:MAG TPA: hypothetical protein VND65_03215 [Candidatus Binatia bacterium]|nr:hypothetical protein [Candidatus Binatia bacterium]
MAEVAQDTQQEFWRPATMPQTVVEAAPAAESSTQEQAVEFAETCGECGSEYMIGARFCHTCGLRRPKIHEADARHFASLWTEAVDRAGKWIGAGISQARKLSPPAWLRYLHFHEIQRGIGLPTAPLVAFIVGLGCVAGAVGVSLFYKASNLAEFQAIQMWRIESLLGATASFLAGILLKKPTGSDPE